MSQATRPPLLVSELPLGESFDAGYLEYYRILPMALTDTHVRVAVAGDPIPTS